MKFRCSFLIGLALALLSGPVPGADDRQDRPNIILVLTDDHAAQAISAYGSAINRTPNIDRLAREGMLFRNCFCTNSICAPSRAVILTGKHSHLNGVLDNSLAFDGSQVTFPKLLRAAGYQTALIGKWHLKSNPTGFDRWCVLSAGGGQGTYYNPQCKTDQGPRKYPGYTTDVITDLSLEWLRQGRTAGKPFLLMLQHKAPHREWEPDPKHFDLYADDDIAEPPTLFDDYAGRASPARSQEMTVARHLTERDLKLVAPPDMTPDQLQPWNAVYGPKNDAFRKMNLQGDDLVRWKYQRYIKDYLRCVASVDDNLGRVLDYLDESGLAQNTVVAYCSDQGFFLGEHGWFDKRWMYEESLRMPFIVRWPGVVAAGAEEPRLVQNLDFAETFLEIAGVDVPGDMQGRSLLPLLRGEPPDDWRTSVYYQYYEYPAVHSVQPHYGVRTARHKLIHYPRTDEWELFDLEEDPHEMHNAYSDPAKAPLVEQLKAELARLRADYRVPE